MTTFLGDKSRFAVEVGEFSSGSTQLRRVDLWAAGHWLTCDDNTVYVPQFCASVQRTIDWLRSGCDLARPFPSLGPVETHRRLLKADDGSRGRFWFLNWGPTTDNVLALVFREADQLSIAFEFWREAHPIPNELGVVFVAELPEFELVGVLQQLLTALSSPPDER